MLCKVRLKTHILFSQIGTNFSSTIYWKVIFSLLNHNGTFIVNQVTVFVHIYFWILCHWSTCSSLHQNTISLRQDWLVSLINGNVYLWTTGTHQTLTDFTVQDINSCFVSPQPPYLNCSALGYTEAQSLQVLLCQRFSVRFCQ